MGAHTGVTIITVAITTIAQHTDTITEVVIEVVIVEDSSQLKPGGLNISYFRPLLSFVLSFVYPPQTA